MEAKIKKHIKESVDKNLKRISKLEETLASMRKNIGDLPS